MGSNMIYIVEVLERMLILAAKRLSMIALEKKTERWGAWMGTKGADIGKERREKLSTCKPPAVYQLQHETQTFITVLFKRAAAKRLHAIKLQKGSKLCCFLLLLS